MVQIFTTQQVQAQQDRLNKQRLIAYTTFAQALGYTGPSFKAALIKRGWIGHQNGGTSTKIKEGDIIVTGKARADWAEDGFKQHLLMRLDTGLYVTPEGAAHFTKILASEGKVYVNDKLQNVSLEYTPAEKAEIDAILAQRKADKAQSKADKAQRKADESKCIKKCKQETLRQELFAKLDNITSTEDLERLINAL